MTLSSSQVSADRILVIDDATDNSFLLQTFLEYEGYQVEVANSGFAALAKIESAPPDLVLLDVMMPGMNGFEVAQRLRQNRQLPFIPIVLITGYDTTLISEEAEVRVEGLIHKPVLLDKLLTQVKAILNRSSQISLPMS